SARRPVDAAAPGPLDREPVREPLLTGIKAIDAAVPIGLGQRELILGDRETGKSSIAIDTIINQRHSGVVCVYVSIGSKRASVKETIDELAANEALSHTVMVVADAAEPAPLRYLAAYAGCTLAEWFAYQGRDALVVYDDLTRHAEAYRDISLLLRRPPSREAYPGDIFFVQARLMERSFKLNQALGGGSVTALPILETQQGNISGFIPTNVISMTDGQVYLDSSLFAEGQLPAIDIGRSVSRVGGSAQFPSLREAASNVRIELSQFGEVRGFARFGTILDETTKAQLRRGERVTQLLLQPERHPVSLAVQVALFWALKHELLEDLPPELAPAFEARVGELQSHFPDLDALLRSQTGLVDSARRAVEAWIAAAKREAVSGRGP
ncbi:MAG TPA: F0F1 ATP synthase subunit alpha, partial [Tepidiformaceae bacterium]